MKTTQKRKQKKDDLLKIWAKSWTDTQTDTQTHSGVYRVAPKNSKYFSNHSAIGLNCAMESRYKRNFTVKVA